MTSSLPQTASSQLKGLALPPLENGDRLTRPEFERRYNAMLNVRKAELIEGVVYMASPLRFRPHAKPHGRLITWLGVYETATPCIEMGIEPTVRLDIDNEPQPDGVLLISTESGGHATLSDDEYVEGAPELVVEVAASSAAIDLGDKKRAYRRSGVQEYIAWQVYDQKIDWWQLQDVDYVSFVPDEQGIIHSQVFPGLWLNVAAMLQGDMRSVLAVLQTGINHPEHKTFVQQLEDLRLKAMSAGDRPQ